MGKIILHADFDSFFASCEQHFNPNLRGIPVGITAEHGRTCIIAASREAKKYGIKTGTRTWEAKKILKDIVFISADFERYLDITRKFISICDDYSPNVEVFSIDEVFIDLTSVSHLYPSLLYIVNSIKKRVRDEIGPTITLSIGVSYNKLIAKLASGLSKPDGFSIIERKDLPMLYKNTNLTDVCGIGERLKIRLNNLSVYTLLDLQKIPLVTLRKEFGNIESFQLKKFAFLEDDSPVMSHTLFNVVKSVGRNYCLPQNEYNQTKILQTIYELCGEIGFKLRRLGRKARTVGLSLSGEKSTSSEKTIARYINLDKDIFSVCKFLYDKWGWNFMVRQISVWTTNLTDPNFTPLSLFDDPKEDKAVKIVDHINETFGNHTIRNGFLLYSEKLPTKPNGFSK